MNSTFFFNALASYMVVIDPIGCALIFYSLTIGQSFRSRARTLLKALGIAATIIVLFGLYGQQLLAALGISMDALRVAGGILLFNTAFRMITSEPVPDKPHTQQVGDITVYPLTISCLLRRLEKCWRGRRLLCCFDRRVRCACVTHTRWSGQLRRKLMCRAPSTRQVCGCRPPTRTKTLRHFR